MGFFLGPYYMGAFFSWAQKLGMMNSTCYLSLAQTEMPKDQIHVNQQTNFPKLHMSYEDWINKKLQLASPFVLPPLSLNYL
jgi:hypothetical protein